MALRKGQRELVEQYRGGYCAVPAIPGGGKTHCLSMWAVEMIGAGLHKPGKILIVTYMNSAVNNFKQRIAAELQKRGIAGGKDYFVSTIHGLCMQIIREKPDLIIANEEFQVIDEAGKFHLIHSIIEEWRRNNEKQFRYFLDPQQLTAGRVEKLYKNWQDKLCGIALSVIGDFKCRGLGTGEVYKMCDELPDHSLLKCIAGFYETYDRRLKAGGYLDFDDMLHYAKKLLEEDGSLLEKYRKKFTFVCEDEAQDSNLIQNDILTMIAGGNLLRVGDSNQAICSTFTNSDFRYFKDFCEKPGTQVYHITQSSRSTEDIINLANYFVKTVRESHPVVECRQSLLPQYIQPVDADDERPNPKFDGYGIRVGIFNSWEDEASAVVSQVYHMSRKFPDKTMAVLIPNSWKVEHVVRILESRNIPYKQLDNVSGERNRALRQLGRVVDFLNAPEDGSKLSAMVCECFLAGKYDDAGEHKKKLADFLSGVSTENILYPREGQANISGVSEELSRLNIWEDFLKSLDTVREILEYPQRPVEKLILFIAGKLDFDREERAIAQKVASDARYLFSRSSYTLESLAGELLHERGGIFGHFAGIVWDLKGYEPGPGVAAISTYHKSKGLEWDIVFLTGLNYEDFPVELKDKFKGEYWYLKPEYRNPRAVTKSELERMLGARNQGDSVLESKIETISEKARLLYVGITRAKEYLFLSGVHANPGKRNEILPSRYLLELKKYVDGCIRDRHPESSGKLEVEINGT